MLSIMAAVETHSGYLHVWNLRQIYIVMEAAASVIYKGSIVLGLIITKSPAADKEDFSILGLLRPELKLSGGVIYCKLEGNPLKLAESRGFLIYVLIEKIIYTRKPCSK